MAKVLLTGADGFIGRALAPRLRAAGHEVVAVTRVRGLDAGIAIGDIGDYDDWRSILGGVEVVVHSAARTHILHETERNRSEEFQRVNVDATLRLARAAAQVGVRHFIFLSSIKVNGAPAGERPFIESDEPQPADPYDISKWRAECGLMEIAATCSLRLTRVRPTLVIGPGAKGNLHRLMRLIDSGLPLPLGAVHNRRSMIVLSNLCELLLLCVNRAPLGDELFLAADAECVSTVELLRYIALGLNKPARLFSVPVPLLQWVGRALGASAEIERMVSSLRVDAAHARRQLNWSSSTSLGDGIIAMAQAYRMEHHGLKDRPAGDPRA